MTMTTEQVIAHQEEVWKHKDLDAIMTDYAEDALVIGPMGVLKGWEAIHAAYGAAARRDESGNHG